MAEEFDTGPLTWVKDEIDNSLDVVLTHLAKLNDDFSDISAIKGAKTHLYQANGALDMVGLEGCHFYTVELEKCLTKLERDEVVVDKTIIDNLVNAVETLKAYLENLMQGAGDVPLRLYDALASVVSGTGRELEQSELFFVDTSFVAPQDVKTQELLEADYLTLINQQRSIYQRSLLQWLQTSESGPLKSMGDALAEVCYAQTRNAPKTLWWVASAFIHSLSDQAVSSLPSAKRLCRKVDQELKLLLTAAKANPPMLKDMLYYIAVSDTAGDSVAKVKEVFSLHQYVDTDKTIVSASELIPEELEAVKQLLITMDALDAVWYTISESIDLHDTAAVNAVDNVLLTKCTDLLQEKNSVVGKLSKAIVMDLYNALSQALAYVSAQQNNVTPVILIELSAGIHLLTGLLNDYAEFSGDQAEKALVQIQRLEKIALGEAYDQFTYERTVDLEPELLNSVVEHIKHSLTDVEKILDAFFRKPEDKSHLSMTAKPLDEVVGTFHMLDMEVASEIAKLAQEYITYFKSNQFTSNEGEFELVAESLSMLGMYVDEMPNISDSYHQAMQSALDRMHTLIEGKRVEPFVELEKTPIPELLEAEKHTEVNVTDQALDDQLLDIYVTEAEEVLTNVAEQLALLKQGESQDALIEIRRGYHTLKGSGRTVGLSHVGEVAGRVENFLNKVIENNEALNVVQAARLEEMSVIFVDWTSTLKETKQLQFDLDYYLAEIETWSALEDQTQAPESKTVLIDDERELSRQFYNIFLNESMLNITILEQDLARLAEKTDDVPSEKARHAVHTVASNALAAGFEHMGQLSRAAELWLEENQTDWSTANQKIYSRLIKALARMWQSVSELKEPKEQKALMRAIQKATPSFEEGNQAEAAVTEQEEGRSDVNEAQSLEDDQDAEITALFLAEADEQVPQIGTELRAWNKDRASFEHTDALQRALHTLKGSARMAGKNDLGDIVHHMEEQIVQALKLKTVNDELFDFLFADLDNIAYFVDTGGLRTPVNELSLPPTSISVQPDTDADSVNVSEHTEDAIDAEEKTLEVISDDASTQEEPVESDIVEKTEALAVEAEMPSQEEVLEEVITPENEPSEETGVVEPLAEAVVETQEVEVQAEEVQPLQSASNRKMQFVRMRADNLDRLINEAGEISIIRSRIDKELLGFKTTSYDLTENVSRMKDYLRELEIEAETQLQSRLNVLQDANDDDFDPLEFDRFTRLQELTRMMAESVNDITTIQQTMVQNLDQTEAALQQQNRMNRDLQQRLMNVRMLPFSQLSDRLYRLVRQTASELDKQVSFSIVGEKTTIDRSVLEKIGAPLEHLLRNAIAHGIEQPSDRQLQEKEEAGQLVLNVSIENEEIKLAIKDDGAGIDLAKVKDTAIKNNLINADKQMSDQELTSLIFEPGFSTADNVTQIAGRGVGLDAVRNDITSLGGRIDIESQQGQGTQFTVYLPLTLSVAQVLMVSTPTKRYALSVSLIEQAQTVKLDVLKKAYEDGYVEWSGHRYPIHYLAKLLAEDNTYQEQPYASILLIRSGQYRIALHVDEMLGNEEVVMKEIGEQLARVPGVMGATVTGEGEVILILNPVLLANREVMSAGAVKVKVKETPVVKKGKFKALVVDDSLTMRKVLGRLMEREGYDVEVAKDGMDAMQMLQSSTPDIILSDIEMPKLDGFGLARNIRDDARTKETPLIFISSRTAEKHQSLAQEIGVDAFFGKPVQDDELIATVKKLLEEQRTVH